MATVLHELLELLQLEKIEETLFRGQSQDLGWGAVFGGQVLGQALSAAKQTVPESRRVHSMHGYFLRRGDARLPIVYDVDCIRDGKSFTTRRVVAIQKGRAIFNMAASFQIEETGYEHADAMPETPGPEGLVSELERVRERASLIPPSVRDKFTAERPIEIRIVDPVDPINPDARPPARRAWFRASDTMPDDLRVHQYVLAYASDFSFLSTALLPHRARIFDPRLQIASLDHAMWFHRPFRMDEWLLHVVESPSAAGARGLVRGHWYSRDGQLVASTVQEGLIRWRGDEIAS